MARYAGFAFAVAGVVSAAPPPRMKSVVRADARGRLVRAVVVSPRAMPSTVTQPTTTDTSQAENETESIAVPDLIEDAARRYNVDPLLVHSMIQAESNYNPYAVSSKGAQGLMQLMPSTARRFGVRNTFDVRENIEGGVRYLRYLGTLFPDDPRLAIAAYNAGEGAVWKYGNNIPPYRETRQYVERVGTNYGKARRAAGQKQAAAAIVETAQSVAPSEPQIRYEPVHVFIDSEGRLHLSNTLPTGSPSEQNP